MKNKSKYLIIGNSVASINAIESIREIDNKNPIILVSNEPYHTYSRPLISYLLAGKVKETDMLYRSKDFYKDNNVITFLGKKVMSLDTNENSVVLDDKEKIYFETLLIATGGTPIVPPIKGLATKGVFTFTTLDDAKKIKEYIEKNKIKDALVIGAGLIGLKATEGLLANNLHHYPKTPNRVLKTTIVELADRILSATFDKKASSIIDSALDKIGCNIITNNTVVEIVSKNSNVCSVKLKNKKTVKTNMVIVAIGVVPNIEIVKNTDIKTNRGILVNEFMETNISNIFAAGDAVEAYDSISNVNRTIAIWPNASRQGKKAGANMASYVLKNTLLKKEYTGGFPMNSVELCDIPTISVGLTDPKQDGFEVLEKHDIKNNLYKKIILKDNKIVGIIFVGNIDNAGIYTGLIRDKIDVSSFKEHLLKDDFGLISFPKDYRKHLVTGAGIEV